MKRIKATFAGTNGSLGYVTGVEYDLVFQQNIQELQVSVHRTNGAGVCIYSNTIAFFENWTNIKILL